MKGKNIVRIAVGAGLMLLIPLFAMQVSSGWNWTWHDFVFAFVFLFITGFLCEFLSSKIKTRKHRIIANFAVIFVAICIWVLLATG
jgi:peptidoglycan/LPS O-acetylase OafA/YrhL